MATCERSSGLPIMPLYKGCSAFQSRRCLVPLCPLHRTSFGFIPEVIGRHDDLVLCETCALMDYFGLGVTLANHGHPEYWNDIERTVRNQLAESQATDGAWLTSETSASDTDQFSWREIGERIIGAWAGWSSPTQILAARENLQWGGPSCVAKRVLSKIAAGAPARTRSSLPGRTRRALKREFYPSTCILINCSPRQRFAVNSHIAES